MSLCKPLTGSKVFVSLLPNAECLPNPKVERVIATVAAAVDSEQITIGLDPAYAAGTYTATSSRNLYANTVLYFGTGLSPVKIVEDVTISTTPTLVKTAPIRVAVAVNDTADSYLAGRLCLNSKVINANTQTAAANEDCDEGGLLKNVITGVTRDMALTGQIQTSFGYWLLLQRLGNESETAFYYQDFNRLYGSYGTLQLGAVSETNVVVGSNVEFQTTAQIFSFKQHLPGKLVGAIDPLKADQVLFTSTQKLANDVVRRLWGYDTILAV